MKTKSHYDYLDEHAREFGNRFNICQLDGYISAHGDKCYAFEEEWKLFGIPFYKGVAIYLLTYVRPFSLEVRQTKNGWVDPKVWVITNKDRFLQFLPDDNELDRIHENT